MERTIGDLGAEIRQPSNPFANLTQRALQCAQVNGLKSIFPDLDIGHTANAAHGRIPIHILEGGYSLHHPREDRPRPVRPCEARAILEYLGKEPGTSHEHEGCQIDELCVQRWARCGLPNGQICRSAWKELQNNVSRMSRNIKVCMLSNC